MSSILTNTSSMVALQTLRSISNALDTTNNRVSTGLRVSSAADNVAYWSIAMTTKSDTGALGAVRDALGLGAASVETAMNGLEKARESLQKVKEKLITAVAPEADRAKLQTEIRSLLDGIKTIADSSVSSGNNWLSVDKAGETKDIVSSFSRSDSSVSLDTMSVNMDDFALYEAGMNTGIIDRKRTVPFYYANLKFSGVSFDAPEDRVEFDVTVGGVTSTILIDQNIIRDVHGNGSVAIGHSSRMVPLLEEAFRRNGINELSFVRTGFSTAYISSENNFNISRLRVIVDNLKKDILPRDFGLASGIVSTVSERDLCAVNDIDVSVASREEIIVYIGFVDQALEDLTAAHAKAGALANRIESQDSFVSALMDANDRTVGTLVDADMEEESARLKALQVQRDLAVQSLSVANASGQNVLSLFRG
ncbi:flagellin [Amorphus sp. 3PC139-8]|uniref:flagellin N-terminal helical domain-containing protein n=1 Tax=Amorphus sp. 3PC139-8 TaxID=2735676 RepID=UPI00345DBC03